MQHTVAAVKFHVFRATLGWSPQLRRDWLRETEQEKAVTLHVPRACFLLLAIMCMHVTSLKTQGLGFLHQTSLRNRDVRPLVS